LLGLRVLIGAYSRPWVQRKARLRRPGP